MLPLLADIAKAVGAAAPLLATALGSPIAGTAIALLEQKFGVPAASLAATIAADPDAALKLQELEDQHREALASIDQQTYATEVDDRKDARAYQAKTGDYVPHIIALVFLVIYAGVQFAALYNPDTKDDVISARVQDIMLAIIGYYFGAIHRRIN